MGIDITITAMSRPEILRRTLDSFCSKMLRPHMSIINNVFINIDPGGTATQRDTAKVCSEFFSPKKITTHLPYEASFPKAFIWTWRQALTTNSACVLHLEDDWELLTPVDAYQMFILLHLYPDLSVLRLSAFRSGTHIMKCWDKLISWNGTFFEVPPNLRGLLGFCGHPSLVRKDFIKHVLPHLDDTRNPEKQIKGKHPKFGQYIMSHRFGVYHGQDQPPTIKDIGRRWMIDNGFKKAGSKAWFTRWENVNGEKNPEPEVKPAAVKEKSNVLKLIK